MKISSFDLNLFVIMNAIYTEGSLTKAAEVVGITQPAVSNALSRLREKFNDDLFVRTGSGMVPTHKTENIINDIQSALGLMQKSVNEPDEFDPLTSERTFRISLGDISEGRILPHMLEKINATAPKITIESFYTDRHEIVHSLATNELNFAIDPIIPRSKDVVSQKVFEDKFICAHRANHPISKIKNFDLLLIFVIFFPFNLKKLFLFTLYLRLPSLIFTFLIIKFNIFFSKDFLTTSTSGNSGI